MRERRVRARASAKRAAGIALALVVLWGCSDGGGGGPTSGASGGAAGVGAAPAPSRAAASFALAQGSASGFTRPSGLAIAKDGKTLFFTAFRASDEAPGVFSLDLGNQAVTPVHVGEPFVEPRALAVSPDGGLLLIVDAAAEVGEQVGTVFRLPLPGPAVPTAVLPAGVLELPAGVAIDRLGSRAYVTGFAEDGPAVLAMTLDGAAPRLLCVGAPLEDPVDVLVSADQQSVIVLDSSAAAGAAPALFRVPAQGGTPEAVTTGLPLRCAAGLAADPFGMELYVAGAAPESAFAGVLGVALSGQPRVVVNGAPHAEPSGLVQSPVSPGVLYAADAVSDTIVAVMR